MLLPATDGASAAGTSPAPAAQAPATATQPPAQPSTADAGTQPAATGTPAPAATTAPAAQAPAANTAPTGQTDGAAAKDGQQTTDNKPPEKSFTQKELDFIVQERVKRAKEGMPSAEDLKAFKEWQESQKTEAQKQAEQLAAEKARADTAASQLTELKQLEAVRKQNVDETFVGYVHYEANRKAAAENITFDEALVTIMAESADKYKRQETRQVNVTTGDQQKPDQPAPLEFNFTGVRPKPKE